MDSQSRSQRQADPSARVPSARVQARHRLWPDRYVPTGLTNAVAEDGRRDLVFRGAVSSPDLNRPVVIY